MKSFNTSLTTILSTLKILHKILRITNYDNLRYQLPKIHVELIKCKKVGSMSVIATVNNIKGWL